MQQLEGRTALVTGAASGIGLGMTRTFAREGMSVVLCDIRGDRLGAALAEVRALGGKAIAFVTTAISREISMAPARLRRPRKPSARLRLKPRGRLPLPISA